jgi:hypothetical protein
MAIDRPAPSWGDPFGDVEQALYLEGNGGNTGFGRSSGVPDAWSRSTALSTAVASEVNAQRVTLSGSGLVASEVVRAAMATRAAASKG